MTMAIALLPGRVATPEQVRLWRVAVGLEHEMSVDYYALDGFRIDHGLTESAQFEAAYATVSSCKGCRRIGPGEYSGCYRHAVQADLVNTEPLEVERRVAAVRALMEAH